MKSINVDGILNDVRKDIKERQLEDTEIQFSDIILVNSAVASTYSKQEFIGSLERASDNVTVASYRPLHGNFISKFIKKINRRLIAFYIESIVDDQNEFNKYTFQAMSMLPEKIEATDDIIKALEDKVYENERRIAELERQLAKK